jgi:arylsulfatase/arylsulfatase A
MKSLIHFALVLASALSLMAQRPNVILLMTDDQGIGDFGVMGNELIETPNIDALAAKSGSIETFYVSPVCSPTRASLMTGRYNQRTRCIDTWLGRSSMDPDEYTLAEALNEAGYATGIFGKWHLGDVYPMRPQEQGFEKVLMHRGGGLAQPSEPLENNQRYTDPILFDESGKSKLYKGFCTDVYFDAAMNMIDEVGGKKPFFIYLPTNAPHGPYHDVPEDLRQHYMEKDLLPLSAVEIPENLRAAEQDMLARIAAMITNEDQNMGRLVKFLIEKGLLENTILVRLNDNGPNSMRYVGDMRGMKTWVHEGGVRSPLWIHWPAKIAAGRKAEIIAAHIDIMPTLLEACGAKPGKNRMDGTSFLGLLTGAGKAEWPERKLVLQTHRGTHVVKYHHFMIREGDWKLLNASGFSNENFPGEPKWELYNLKDDPKETVNLAARHPERVARLKMAYEEWFEDVSSTRPDNYAPPLGLIGTEHENPTTLTRQDWLGSSWEVGATGYWEVEVAKAVIADIEVIFHPEEVKGDSAVTLHAGEVELTQKTNGHRITFHGVALPQGKLRLEGVRSGEGRAKGAWQLIINVH